MEFKMEHTNTRFYFTYEVDGVKFYVRTPSGRGLKWIDDEKKAKAFLRGLSEEPSNRRKQCQRC